MFCCIALFTNIEAAPSIGRGDEGGSRCGVDGGGDNVNGGAVERWYREAASEVVSSMGGYNQGGVDGGGVLEASSREAVFDLMMMVAVVIAIARALSIVKVEVKVGALSKEEYYKFQIIWNK